MQEKKENNNQELLKRLLHVANPKEYQVNNQEVFLEYVQKADCDSLEQRREKVVLFRSLHNFFEELHHLNDK